MLRASLGWRSKSNSFNESEMALFYECMQSRARKVIDTTYIARDAMLRQLRIVHPWGELNLPLRDREGPSYQGYVPPPRPRNEPLPPSEDGGYEIGSAFACVAP